MVEEWKVYKTVCNGKRIYEVSNFGRVKINGNLVYFDDNKTGYYSVAGFRVHRAVAELFITNQENKPCVDHIDTNPHNNRVDNLRWVTYKENNNNSLTRQHAAEAFSRPEIKQKRSESQKVAQNRPETRQKQSEAQKVAQNRPEIKLKKSEAIKKSWDNPEIRGKRVKGMKCKQKSKNEINKKEQLSLFLNKGWKIGRKL